MAPEPPSTPALATADTTTPVPRPQRLWPGLALATAGSIAFSGKAIIVKLAYRHDVDAVTLIMYRRSRCRCSSASRGGPGAGGRG